MAGIAQNISQGFRFEMLMAGALKRLVPERFWTSATWTLGGATGESGPS